jgi:hypothetical protein
MMRTFVICFALIAAPAVALDNPNSPRTRRDMRVNPPRPPSGPKWFEIVEPERWPTLSRPIGQPYWGHIGKCGWVGVIEKPPGC